MLDRYGLGDASSLIERPVFLTTPTDGDLVRLIPAARRVDYSQGSPIAGVAAPAKRRGHTWLASLIAESSLTGSRRRRSAAPRPAALRAGRAAPMAPTRRSGPGCRPDGRHQLARHSRYRTVAHWRDAFGAGR